MHFIKNNAIKSSNEGAKKAPSGTFFQPKRTINEPGDQYEREADATADKVMRMSINDQPFFKPSPLSISRLQRKCKDCEDEEKLQRKENSSQPNEASSETSSYINSLSSKGSSLTESVRGFFEPRFGYDFSDVKIHNDTEAANSAQSINALAYTANNHIVFNQNQFSPESESGKKILAHELTHVVQQQVVSNHSKMIQRIKVSSAGGAIDGTCGKFERRFTFTLDNPALTDGYFIQQIDRYDSEVNCPGIGSCPANPTNTFWEAFFVKQKAKTFYRQGIGFTDSSSHDSRPDKSGARYAKGEIRFFPIAITGDLGRNRIAGLWKPGNAGGVPASHNLPSVDKQPAWWSSYTEGPASRYVTTDWRCCHDDKDYNFIKSSV